MTPKQFVAKQLELPERARVIPDRIYMADNRLITIQMLRAGINPFDAGDAFKACLLYAPASYFHPGEVEDYGYYPNGVFSL